ncbi:hypothetical protein CVT25_015635 [Psilocybe cyanescens]|uniref:Uncharacterized protein n=1 Tax=Psilocybe cyanescens TaxID=93625 RepID=A0A409WHZ5_PSICY|nr:hypothetical protein CVT25_015635 [Psilocybe cyanescens]
MAVEPLLATRAQRAFIATKAIVVLVMVGLTFHKVDDNVPLRLGRYKTVSCYLALFALAELFELFMAFDALRLRNIIQLFGILIFHGALIVFAALQIHQTKTALVTDAGCDSSTSYVTCGGTGTLWSQIKPFLIVAPSVIGASWFFMLFWIKQLYGEFGWAIFHVVGANPKMKTMYQWYQIMICLLKFDFFFFTGVTMQLLIIVLQRNSAEFGITVAAIPVVLILLIFCGIAVQREIKSIMTISLVMMLASLSYLYKLVRFYQPASRDQYLTTRATLTTFTIVAFILLLSTFAVGVRCFSDFDRGLQSSKTHSVPVRPSNSKVHSSGNMSQSQSNTSGIPLGPRISIE